MTFEVEEATEVVLTEQLAKTIISAASARRPVHLSLRVTDTCGRSGDHCVTLRNITPETVVIKDDGRIGFHADGMSFITVDKASGEVFRQFLQKANQLAPSGEDYGQPGQNCHFKRCC